MKRTIKIFIITTILLIPAYLIRFIVFGIPTNILEVLMLITFFISLLSGEKFNWKFFYFENKVYIFGVVLILAGLLISTLINENYRVGFGIIKGWFIVPLLFAWVLYKKVKNRKDLENVLKWLYLGIFGVAAVSLIYYFQGNLTYDGRLKAFYLSSNYLAMYLAPAVFIGVYFIQNEIIKIKDKKQILKGNKEKYFLGFITISLIIILLALYLTYSYAAWLAIISSLIIIILIFNKKIYKSAILIGLIILLLIIISQRNTEKFDNLKSFSRSSLESRIIIWKSAIKILESNVIWGIGPGNFQNKYLEYQKYFPAYLEWAVPQPHNLYLAFWLEGGIAGLAGFLTLIILWIKNLLKFIKMNDNNSVSVTVLLGIMLYILIHGLVDTPYWKNDLAVVFWIILFLGIISIKISQNYELSHPKS
jgi:O-antigen ligase